MKIIFVFLATLASILAIMLLGLLIYNLEIVSSVAGLTFGLLAFYLSKKNGKTKKIVQFAFIFTIVVLVITAYKSIFAKNDIVNPKTLQITRNGF
ncbi:FUSC family protein [Flavivirga amylovorans]|uniref:FUSC family protein n=1 Tax=Flavivirga amylovorans TaxID=870486 RepID=A0ABT8X416_9FLAO|nr:FUSC family protein [Flavivirga amylovorans]MDO5988693.1 FUSC family protein [Flavivirga amylovorans]